MLRGKVIKGLFLSSLSLGLFFGYASVSNNSNLNENVSAKTNASLKRYKTGIPRKLPAGVPLPTSPKLAPVMRGLYIGNTGNITPARANKVAPKMINWLKAGGSKSSGSLHDSRGYLIPGKGQKVYRVSDPGNYQYTYYSTLANGHRMIGQTNYRSYNMEVIPGIHKIADGFTNPSHGKNWVLYYVSDYKKIQTYYTPDIKGFKLDVS